MVERRYLNSTEPVYYFEVYGRYLLYTTASSKIMMLDLSTSKIKELSESTYPRLRRKSLKIIGNSVCFLQDNHTIARHSFRGNCTKPPFILNLSNCEVILKQSKMLENDKKVQEETIKRVKREIEANNDCIADFCYEKKKHRMLVLTVSGLLFVFFEGGLRRKCYVLHEAVYYREVPEGLGEDEEAVQYDKMALSEEEDFLAVSYSGVGMAGIEVYSYSDNGVLKISEYKKRFEMQGK